VLRVFFCLAGRAEQIAGLKKGRAGELIPDLVRLNRRQVQLNRPLTVRAVFATVCAVSLDK